MFTTQPNNKKLTKTSPRPTTSVAVVLYILPNRATNVKGLKKLMCQGKSESSHPDHQRIPVGYSQMEDFIPGTPLGRFVQRGWAETKIERPTFDMLNIEAANSPWLVNTATITAKLNLEKT